MKLFLDKSSLVKLYHDEPGTDELIAEVSRGYDELCLSELARLEFRSALWKKVRTGELADDLACAVISCFEEDADKFRWVPLDASLIDTAQKMLMLHGNSGLRTLDSIQLASALVLNGVDTFCSTADEILHSIMLKEGLKTVSPWNQ